MITERLIPNLPKDKEMWISMSCGSLKPPADPACWNCLLSDARDSPNPAKVEGQGLRGQSDSPPQTSPQDAEVLRPGETTHQQVGWGPGPSWKRPATSFHGARRHGNQTSAAGLQQSQERQAPFLSISQESKEGVRREVGTIRLSEPGWRWGQGDVEVVFPLNGSAINHRNVAPYFTPLCLRLLFRPMQ